MENQKYKITKEQPLLSIVLPCYNEEDIIQDTLTKLTEYMDNYFARRNDILKEEPEALFYEVVPVSDGSKDRTNEILLEMKEKHPAIHPVIYAPNRGKGGAVKEGMSNAKGQYVMFMDADLSVHPRHIDTLLKHFDNYDVVVGSRHMEGSTDANPSSLLRKMMSEVSIILTHIVIPYFKLTDTQCPLKGFTQEATKKIIEKQTLNNFSFDVEMLAIAALNGYKITQMPVEFNNRLEGSKVNPIKDSLNYIRDMFYIRGKKKHYE